MLKNIGLVWLKDDFRIKKNLALIEATKNHDQVVAFFLYKKRKFENQEAQGWWVSQSLKEFKKSLFELNINLEVLKTESYKAFFQKLFCRKKISRFIGIKLMSLITSNLTIFFQKILKTKGLIILYSKEIYSTSTKKLKKMMERHLRFSHHFGELLKNIIMKKSRLRKRKFQNVRKKFHFFQTQ